MSVSDDEPAWMSLAQELHVCLKNDKFQEASALCCELKREEDELPEDVRQTLWEVDAKCLLQLERYDEVIQQCQKSDDAHKCKAALLAYAHYRRQHYDRAIQLASDAAASDNDPVLSHIVAQSRYRLHEYAAAADLYDHLLKSSKNNDSNDNHTDAEERVQVLTNALAVALAQATPHVETQPLSPNLLQPPEDSHAYDAWFNLATYQLVTGSDPQGGLALLEQAEKACVATLEQEGADASAVAAEVAPIQRHARSWSRQWTGQAIEEDHATDSKNMPAAVSTIQALNRALAASSLKALPPLNPSWTALQQRLYHYNRAVLQLRHKHYSDCLATCQHMLQSSRKKEPRLPTLYANDLDEAWWKARIAVVQAHAQVQQHPDKAAALLQYQLDSLQKQQHQKSPIVVDRIVAHVQLHLAYLTKDRLAKPDDMLQVLMELPESLQSSKAVVATLASLHQELGNMDQATQLLQEAGGAALAEYAMAQGDYQRAVTLCEQEGGDKVRLVEALSHVDPARAKQVWDELELEDDESLATLVEELDGEALEARDLPRRSRKTAANLLPTTTTTVPAKNKKSREAVLKRRARQREAYLNTLIAQGKFNPDRPSAPDTERWIPKHERSYNRRRRHRGQNKGHQGGASEKDAAKLDVAARKEGGGTTTSGAPSTAHLVVAGDSKRGGRRR